MIRFHLTSKSSYKYTALWLFIVQLTFIESVLECFENIHLSIAGVFHASWGLRVVRFNPFWVLDKDNAG